MGDNHLNVGTDKVKVGLTAFQDLVKAFTVENTFDITTTFRFYNFCPELTPLLGFVDCLTNNQTLQTIGFARNCLDEDACAGILQRVYMNPPLKTFDINGNNITNSHFIQNYLKPYFSTRDINIILD